MARPSAIPVVSDAFAWSEPELRTSALGGDDVTPWPEDLLRAVHRVLADECGPAADAIWRSAARQFGERLARHIQRGLSGNETTDFQHLPAARVQAGIASALAQHGLGRAEFNFDRHDRGMWEVAVTDGPSRLMASGRETTPDQLLAGLFAGLFSVLTGQPLECLQTDYAVPGSAPARFIISIPERLARVAPSARQGQPHERVLSLLEAIEV